MGSHHKSASLIQQIKSETVLVCAEGHNLQTRGYSSENRRDIFICGGEAPFMNYCWRTPKGRKPRSVYSPFELPIKGYCLAKIARELNDRHVPTARSGLCYPATVT